MTTEDEVQMQKRLAELRKLDERGAKAVPPVEGPERFEEKPRRVVVRKRKTSGAEVWARSEEGAWTQMIVKKPVSPLG